MYIDWLKTLFRFHKIGQMKCEHDYELEEATSKNVLQWKIHNKMPVRINSSPCDWQTKVKNTVQFQASLHKSREMHFIWSLNKIDSWKNLNNLCRGPQMPSARKQINGQVLRHFLYLIITHRNSLWEDRTDVALNKSHTQGEVLTSHSQLTQELILFPGAVCPINTTDGWLYEFARYGGNNNILV
jgi:hypothetical protein